MNFDTYIVLLKEGLRVVVTIDVNLGKSVEGSRLRLSSVDLCLKERQDELESVALLYLVNKLINAHCTGDGAEELLDRALIAVDIEQTTDDLRSSSRVDSLDVDLQRNCQD